MSAPSSTLPAGMAGLRYGITQVSLAVRDLDRTMALYHRAFGWAPWQVFDHVLPVHHNTELRGQPVHYALRGAEVYVGSLNFELLQPLEGPNLWSEFMDRRGEGVASIATMFLEREDGDAVKVAFKERFGIDVSMKADIGDHIEYYYLDTESQFGCLIESGSGHAIDFVKPAQVYPRPGAEPGPSQVSGITYPITQISLTVRDLEAKMRAYRDAFGWGPWEVFDADRSHVLHDTSWRGEPSTFLLRWAQTMVGDMNFELVEPLGPGSPFQEFLETKGEGISSIGVTVGSAEESERVRAQFAADGIGVTARGRIGDAIEWYLLDTEPGFKCAIAAGTGHANEIDAPHTMYP
jgi:methylmalonyl-CoA/ethylmalonyl-CoA epimerase